MRITLAVLIAIALLAGSAAASDEEALQQLKAGLYARSQSITSCQGSVHLATTAPLEEGERLRTVQVLRVAFDGERLRMSGDVQSGPAVSFEGLGEGEKTTLWLREPGAGWHVEIHGGRDTVMHDMFSLCVDPRMVGALQVTSPGPWPQGDARIAGREAVNGHACVVLELA